MPKPTAVVVRAPGTNCHEETAFAFESAGAVVEIRRLGEVLEGPAILEKPQIFCVPGGFSYGDDLGAGRIFASKLSGPLGDRLKAFRDRGGLILGVCNGFQVLLQTGLLIEPSPDGTPRATLTQNAKGRFEDRWVHLKLTPGRCVFIDEVQVITLPVAHGEGNFIVESASLIDDLEAQHRIACRYVDADGRPGDYPVNPNGSTAGVAGVCDETGRVFALMPHPERHISPYQHPHWTRRENQPEHGDGFVFFRNAVRYFA
jgi:phosphoribosylformylglycinamidine synthase subunit PurQ / glutaminase